jgi:2-dehydropantoate 2-reductase
VKRPPELSPPRFCIYGAGAIGGMIGVLLARTGASVSVVARGETLLAVKRNGLQLITGGERLHVEVQASATPRELGVQDYVIVCVKAASLRAVAMEIAPLLGPQTAVVSAMNGVPWWFFANAPGPLAGARLSSIDWDGAIGSAIPAARAIGCVLYVGCSRDGPGVVHHYAGKRLLLGEADNSSSARLDVLLDWLRRAGFDAEQSGDIRADIWVKLWANLSTNPISLLTETTLDKILDDPLVHQLCLRMMEEAKQIGSMIGIKARLSTAELIMRARSFGAHRTSMLQDLERGAPVEIDAVLTAVHEIGELVGVPTPFIDSVLGLARLRASTLGLLAGAT